MEKSKNPRLDHPVFRIIHGYREEASSAKRNRMDQNRDNWECYHLRQDYSHKRKGQSKEFLAKQQSAVEQITSFLQQGLMDAGEWYDIELEMGVQNSTISPAEMKKLLSRQLAKNKIVSLVADGVKSGLLGSLMIVKVGGMSALSTKYKSETKMSLFRPNRKVLKRIDKRIWQLQLSLVRQEDYYPDPSGRGLYEIQDIDIDYHELLRIAKENPDDYDMQAVLECAHSSEDSEQEMQRARETDQNVSTGSTRKVISIHEMWGTLVDPSTGEVIGENVVCAVTKDGHIIRPMKPSPWWHGRRPFVVSPIVRVPNSVWHRALMDAPTKHNRALNEIYNLQLDSGLMSVWGIKQVREDWLDDPSQISDGIPPGISLLVNSSCPPNAKVVERVDTGSMTREGFEIFQLTDREFQTSSLTNDTRMGNLPQRAVKATEIVASNQSITGIFNGITKVIEEDWIMQILDLSWLSMAQNMNDLDVDEVKAMVGDDRAMILSNMAPEDRFAATAQGHKFKVFGLSTVLNKVNDFRKFTALLQTIGTSPEMLTEFKRKYSMTKLLGRIIHSLDINEERIEMDPQEKEQYAKEQQAAAAIAMAQAQGGAKGGGGKNPQSQIPQAANSTPETGTDVPMAALNDGMTEP